jgi:hypothetical protein
MVKGSDAFSRDYMKRAPTEADALKSIDSLEREEP